MRIIAKNRTMGKTTELIKRSAETGYPILVFNKSQIYTICEKAVELRISIPTPILICDLINSKDSKQKYVIIDQLDYAINYFLPYNIKVDTCSINAENLVDYSVDDYTVNQEKLINKLYSKYNTAIDANEFEEAYKILKNIDLLNTQIDRDK